MYLFSFAFNVTILVQDKLFKMEAAAATEKDTLMAQLFSVSQYSKELKLDHNNLKAAFADILGHYSALQMSVIPSGLVSV
jgi:hypothetical protein